MEVFVASVVVFGLAVLGMSVGTILGRRSFHGSCRGACGRCGPTSCDEVKGGHTPTHDDQHLHSPKPVIATWGDHAG